MDENSKIGGAPKSDVESNPNPNSDVTTTSMNSNSSELPNNHPESETDVAAARQSSRTPFTNLSQVDADLALARTLQEQERAYMMLSMAGGGVGYGRWDTGIYFPDEEDDDFGDSHDHEYDEDEGDEEGEDVDEDGDEDEDEDGEDEDEDDIDNYDDEEDAFDVHAHGDSGEDEEGVELDPSAFPDDEAYARALQDAEEREMAARLLAMAGITEREIVDAGDHGGDHGGNSQDTWEEVDPDELSYEELLALGEVVGTESRGLSADTIASLPSSNYKAQNTQEDETESCIICRLDYEDGDALTTLPCKHAYHTDCINNWLKINKACPVCSTEVSSSANS